MSDFTKEDVLALARTHEVHADLFERLRQPEGQRVHQITATALRAYAEAMSAVPVFWGWQRASDGFFHDAVFRSRDQAADEQIHRSPQWVSGYNNAPLYASPPVSAPAEPVAVKPLVWHELQSGRVWRAASTYRIEDQGSNWPTERFWLETFGLRSGKYDTLAQAKAIAQADYEARIRFALVSPPAPVAEAGAVVPADIADLIERLLDAQQDINLCANQYMEQPLCDASALIDEVETVLQRLAAAPSPPASEPAKRSKLPVWWRPSPALAKALANYHEIKADFDAFDGDRRGIAAALGEAEIAILRVLGAIEEDGDHDIFAAQISAEAVIAAASEIGEDR